MTDTSEATAAEAAPLRARPVAPWTDEAPTGLLVLADGTVIEGKGAGATGVAVGEVCFNTAMTGYQEILTDPSYAGQIITFTFPHIGNVGTNAEDMETASLAATGLRGCVLRASITEPSNWRAAQSLDQWLKARGIIAITGVDTRALTALIREGMPNAVIAHAPDGKFDLAALRREAGSWPGMIGLDLAKDVTCGQSYGSDETEWRWGEGYGRQEAPSFHVVAIDYGLKRNILRERASLAASSPWCRPPPPPKRFCGAEARRRVFVERPRRPGRDRNSDAVPEIKKLVASGLPVFGICLGHQMLGLALGGTTAKMHQGHHGATHPVKDFTTHKVEITSMNYGFAVDRASLPVTVEETHVSLFDGSNCGLKLKGQPVFSVQYHPEASPGPQDSHYLFTRFVALMDERKGKA